jgi:ribose transport system ATP-binding protein
VNTSLEASAVEVNLLEAGGMTKRYGKVTVLKDVRLNVRAGEIHALLGANGAGKSTLCKMISGLTETTAGEMKLDGRPFRPTTKHDAEASGVQIIQQELNLIPTLSVAENLLLNRLPSFAGFLRGGQLQRQAKTALERLHLDDIDPRMAVSRLGVGRRQMVEIAAALACDCRLLILDEPTSALGGTEAELLFDQLDQLRRQGVAMIYISHRLEEVKTISDRVSILRDGRNVCTEPTASMSTEEMVGRMSGEDRFAEKRTRRAVPAPRSDSAASGIVLAVDSLDCGMVQNVSFEVRAGERFGIAGLVGSGRSELLRAIFGADPASGGGVSVGGRSPRRFRHPAEAVAGGLAMVTEDRKQDGLLLEHSVRENISLSAMSKRFSNRGIVRRKEEQRVAEAMCATLQTRSTGVEQVAGTLSGGNQQKVAIAKWLVRDADVFLFDEPTRGIDVGARRRICKLIDQLSDQGKGIVIVSSDLDELMDISDRIAVMSAGRMVRLFDRDNWSADAILRASFAGHSHS